MALREVSGEDAAISDPLKERSKLRNAART